MRETRYTKKLHTTIRKLNLDKEELNQLLVCLYLNGCPLNDCTVLFEMIKNKTIEVLQNEELYEFQSCIECGQLRNRSNDFTQRRLICNICQNEQYKKNTKRRSQNHKEYYRKNKNRVKAIQKKYRHKMKEQRLKYNRQYYETNGDNIRLNRIAYLQREATVIQVQKLALFEEVKDNQIRCKYCGRWMTPTNIEVQNRLIGIGTNDRSYIYCSEECKEDCPTFQQVKFPKGFKPVTSREVNPVLRQLVLERDQ